MIKFTNGNKLESVMNGGVTRSNNSKLVTLIDDDGNLYHVNPFVAKELIDNEEKNYD